MATTTAPAVIVPHREIRRPTAGFWSDAFWRIRHDPTTLAAFGVFFLMVLLAASADLLAQSFFHADYAKQDILNGYAKPTLSDPALWLGTDNLGRSAVMRLIYGGRVSLFIGIFAAIVSLGIGTAFGLTAGYFRGKWDDFVVWIVTTLNNIPTLYLLIIVGLLFRLDKWSLAILIGVLGWTGITNLSRGQTFSLREREFIVAARTIGASPARIMLRHIFPNLLPLMIVVAMIDVASVILAESSLSYLGFGVQPPEPSWGNMLRGATEFLTRGPWLIYPPGIAIAITVLCLYLIGDGLRDALDPRLRGAR